MIVLAALDDGVELDGETGRARRFDAVEHDGELAFERFQLVDDDGDERVVHVHVAGLESRLRRLAEIRPDAPDGLNDPGPERNGVVVGRIGGEPGNGALVELSPLGEQRRLAESGRCGEENERGVRAEEPRGQPRPRDHLRRGREPSKLRLQRTGDAIAPLTRFTEEGPAAHSGLAPSCSAGATSPSRTASTAA